ncbi:unnamed protein product [Caenorhabditis nigoni]
MPSSSSSSSYEDSEDDYREENEEEEAEGHDDCEAGPSVDKEKAKTVGHRCPHCEKTFPYPNKLRVHLKTHEYNRYQCLECPSPQNFNSFTELKSHRKSFHSQAVHKCPQCSFTTSKPAFIRRHIQLSHINGIPCTVAGCFMKVAKNRMKSHIKEAHSKSVETPSKPIRAKLSFHKCPICAYEPDQSILNAEEQYRDLMAHIKSVHDDKGRKVCTFGCGAVIRSEEDKTHWQTCPRFSTDEPTTSTPRLVDDGCGDTNTVTSQSIVTETSCDYPTEFESDTEVEKIELLSNSLIEADLEEKGSTEEPPLKKCKMGEEEAMKRRFSCEVCSKVFMKWEYVRKHFNACHSKQKTPRVIKKQFKCERKSLKDGEDLCGKSFRTEQALQDHYNVHEGVQPYACVTCNQRFYARDRFAVHLSKYHLTSIKDLTANSSMFGTGNVQSERQPSHKND